MCVLAVKGKATRRDLGGSKPKKKNNIPLALSSVRGHQSHYQVDLGPDVRTRYNVNPGFCSCVQKHFLG